MSGKKTTQPVWIVTSIAVLAVGFVLAASSVAGKEAAVAAEKPAAAAPTPKTFGQIVPAGTEVERVSTGHSFTEGPAWDYKGNLYWSDIPKQQILKLDAAGKISVYRKESGGSNGLMFDKKGRLIACEHRNRRISRTKADGTIETMADRYKGKRLNSPNDLVIGLDGSIYFTDPRYGRRDDLEQDKEAVYRIAPDGAVTRIIDDTVKCNGIHISPDAKTLYVADNGNATLRSYPLKADGTVGKGRVLAKLPGRPDGMTVDAAGNLYMTVDNGVLVLGPDGKELGTIKTPERPANCCFGAADLKTLYITARKSLYRIKLNARGWLVHVDGVKKEK
jgi:gluconolactonase